MEPCYSRKLNFVHNLEKFCFESSDRLAKKSPDKLEKPKTTESFAENLFLGDDTWLGTMQGAFMGVITLGIGPLALYLSGYEDKLERRAKEGLIEEIKKLNYGEEILKGLDCEGSTLDQLAIFRAVIADFNNFNFSDKYGSPEDNGKSNLSLGDLKVLITISLNLQANKKGMADALRTSTVLPLCTINANEDSIFSGGTYSVYLRHGEVYMQERGSDGVIMLMKDEDVIVFLKSHLSGMDLRRRDLNLANKNLADANFNDSFLSGMNLSGANLCGVQMTNVELTGSNFTGAMFNGNEKITLKLPAWNQDTLDRHLNHITNRRTGSILTAINSMDNSASMHKLNLMHQLIKSLENVDTSSVNQALLDIWMKNPLYVNDEQIVTFIKEKILVSQIETTNTSELKVSGEKELQLFLDIVNSKEETVQNKFMLDNNGFFVQLLALCIGHKNSEIKEQAVHLYHNYMNLSEMKGYKNSDTFLGNGPEGNLEEIESNLNEIRDINPEDPAFVFFRKDEDGTTHALVVSQDMIEGMLKPDPNYEWANVTYNRNNSVTVVVEVAEAYSPFPLFHTGYQSQLHKAAFPRLLNAFELNFTNPDNDENTVSRDYNFYFKDALDLTGYKVKLTGDADQIALGKIFIPLLDEDKGVTDQHFKQIDKIFGLSKSRLSTTQQAQYLLCLSAMFVTYSSAYFFGREGESPEALRHYAAGLIIKAKTLDENVSKNNVGEDQSVDWLSRLKGQNSAFTCTAVLKTMMKQHAKEMGFSDLMGRVKPPGW
jgi:hypothetical protein